MRKFALFGLVMMFLLSANALADACSSTNFLLVGEIQTFLLGGSVSTVLQEISKDDHFSLDGNQLQYKGADKITQENPEIAFKDLKSGDTLVYLVEAREGKARFTIKLGGKGYHFESVSDPKLDDYQIGLVSGQTVSGGRLYTVQPVYIGTAPGTEDMREAKLEVNGYTTPGLKEGESFTLPDGAVLTIAEITYQSYAGGIHAVSFCLDGEKGEWLTGQERREEATTKTEPVTAAIDLANYPELFIKDGKLNAYFVVGWKAPAMDNLALTDIASGLPLEVVNVAKLDTEIDDPLNTNLVVVGRPEENTLASLLMGGKKAGDFLKEGEGMLKLFKNEDRSQAQLLVTGYSSEDTRKAAKVLMDYGLFNLQGREIIVKGTMDNPEIKVSEEPLDIEPLKKAEEEEPEPSQKVEIPEEVCGGCRVNGNCLPYGTRLVEEGKAKFCDVDKRLKEQKGLEGACQNSYECLSNQCGDGKCISLYEEVKKTRGVLEAIWEWIKNFFGV